MDKEKAHKFLSLDDRLTVEGIEATHEMGSDHPAGIAKDEMTFDGSNAKTRHRHRGKLLGVIDRLLGTTAYYHGSYQHEAKSAKAYKDAYENEAKSATAHKDAYERAAAELNAANAKLTQLEAFGTLSPWFGGPYAALTINAHYRDKVFGEHKGTSWSFRALSERVVALEKEKENDQLGKLAGKPMQIFDDAQGCHTVNVPSLGGAVTVKPLVANFGGQFETIQRKDEKILEQAKEIKALKASFGYDRFVKDGFVIADLAGKLRQTQEDYGDLMVQLDELTKENNILDARLSEIADVADGYRDDELKANEEDEVAFDIETCKPGMWGVDWGKPGGDFTVVAYVYDPVTGSIKRKD